VAAARHEAETAAVRVREEQVEREIEQAWLVIVELSFPEWDDYINRDAYNTVPSPDCGNPSTATTSLPSRSATHLTRNGAYLRDLNVRYRDWAYKSNIGNLVFFEGYKTLGLQIVDAASADPGLVGAGPIAVDADHFAICKPARRRQAHSG